jgi:lysophospholipase L1-like esterase
VRTRLLAVAAAVPLCLLAQGASAAGLAVHQGVKLKSGAQYVAMGSSYAAGPLIQPQEADSGSCGRSLVSYPHLVTKKLHLKLKDVSCSGAVTANALNTDQGTEAPQIKAVTSHTKLVTMTIGGNDVTYAATAGECGTLPTCGTSAERATVKADFKVLPSSLTKLVRAIRAKAAPKVTIVLVAYPRLVPKHSCAALHYSAAEAAYVGSIGSRLEKVFRSVAKKTHILIADPYVLGAGHGPCAPTGKRWISGFVATDTAAYHPTAAGHREMARLVEKALAAK